MRSFKFPAGLSIMVFVSMMMVISCKPRVRKLASPPHYNFAQAASDKLDERASNISGICWDSKNNLFYIVTSGSGKMFFVDRAMHQLPDEPVFGDNGDYGDVAVYKGSAFILKNDGEIIRFSKDSTGKWNSTVAGKINLSGTNNFQTIYSDPVRNALIVLCKDCKTDDENSVSAFAFYPDSTGFSDKPVFRINAATVNRLSPFKTGKLQPSAAAINPINNNLYIISPASSQLVIADNNGQVQSVYKLIKSLFPQPEGITFNKSGDMIISNKGVNSKPALLTFRYIASSDSTDKAGGYDFTSPDDKMTPGKHLHEISGMAYIPGKDLILGENDEKGDIFTIDFKNKNDNVGSKIKFGGKGDYEDIVYTDSAIYMLVSSGTIIQVETRDSTFNTKEFTLPGDKNEFETLYLDAEKKSLVMLCKECSHEKKTGVRTAYRFDLTTNTFDAEPLYVINLESIHKMLNDDEAQFKPSAAAINPVNGKLYIVASVGKLLVVADRNTGKPEQVIRLNPQMYNQPEGMTIAPNGDLYISNEGGEGEPTILKFIYKKQ